MGFPFGQSALKPPLASALVVLDREKFFGLCKVHCFLDLVGLELPIKDTLNLSCHLKLYAILYSYTITILTKDSTRELLEILFMRKKLPVQHKYCAATMQ